jgi:hypothetical protein
LAELVHHHQVELAVAVEVANRELGGIVFGGVDWERRPKGPVAVAEQQHDVTADVRLPHIGFIDARHDVKLVVVVEVPKCH